MMIEYNPSQKLEEKMNSTSQIEQPSTAAIIGVLIGNDGAISTYLTGKFDAGQADEIARKLVLMASTIRSTARRKFLDANK